MVAVPRIVANQRLGVAPAGPRLAGQDLDGGFGAALTNLGDNASAMADQQARLTAQAANAQQLGAARVQAMSDLADLQAKYANDQDPATMAQRWAADADALQNGYKEKFGQTPIWGAFSQDFAQMRLRDRLDIQTNATKRVAVQGQAQLDSDLDGLAKLQAQTDDPVKQAQIRDIAATSIAEAVGAGYVNEVDAGKLQRSFVSRGDEAKADQAINQNPEAAPQLLADPKNFPNLDPVKREALIARATQHADALRSDRIRLTEKADRDAEKAMTKAGQDRAKQLWAMQADGTLTRDEIEQNRAILPLDEYKGLLKTQDPKLDPSEDDPNTLDHLESLTDPQQLAAAATQAHDAGLLKNDTYRTYMDRSRKFQTDAANTGAPKPYSAGNAMIRDTLNPGELVSGPAAQVARAGLANATAEYQSWFDAHPQASLAEAQLQAQQIIKRYQIVNYQQMAIANGRPIYYTGTVDAMKPADLDAAEDATLAARARGDFSAGQAALEITKIENWRTILNMKPAGSAGSQ
jgi:hypothetical protein